MLEWETWMELFKFYYQSAAVTYAAGIEPVELEQLSGSKNYHLTSPDGKMFFDDLWYAGKGDGIGASGGQIVLGYEGKAVWMLKYWGWRILGDDRIHQFLKEVLSKQYKLKANTLDWSGMESGRGPEFAVSKDGVYTYHNTVRYGTHHGALVIPAEQLQWLPYIKYGALNYSGKELIYKEDDKEDDGSPKGIIEAFRHDYVGFALVN